MGDLQSDYEYNMLVDRENYEKKLERSHETLKWLDKNKKDLEISRQGNYWVVSHQSNLFKEMGTGETLVSAVSNLRKLIPDVK